MTSRVVLLTGRLMNEERYHETRVALDLQWQVLLQDIGYQALVIPPTSSPDQLLSQVRCAGIILTGGNDLSSQTECELSKIRDRFEHNLLREAQRRAIPCLAICRGAQLIGEDLGFHLGPVENHVAVEHPIESPDQIEDYQRCVNSYHNFGLRVSDSLDSGTTILATAWDETVEAFSVPKERLLAWMWHPERAHPSVDIDKNLIQQHFN